MTLGIARAPIDELSQQLTSSVTESALFHGYRRITVGAVNVERCECGGSIVVPQLSDAAIRYAVETHNATDEHVAWQRRVGAR